MQVERFLLSNSEILRQLDNLSSVSVLLGTSNGHSFLTRWLSPVRLAIPPHY